jgi:hypothetical protein
VRSWPQAAAISLPFSTRTVTFTPASRSTRSKSSTR